MNLNSNHFITLFLSLVISWHCTLFPTIFEGTLVQTSNGFVPVEKLRVGEKVISCTTKGTIIEVPIKKIIGHFQGKAHRLFLHKSNNSAEDKYIYAPPLQELYDPFLQRWIKAEQVKIDHWVMDDELNVHPIEYVDTVPVNVVEYHVELDEPHVFFISDCSYTSTCPHNLHKRILVHNFIPVGVSLSGNFASSFSSMSFSDAALTIAGLAVEAHPAVQAAAGVMALSAIGYEVYKSFKHDKNSPKQSQTAQLDQPKIWVLNNNPHIQNNTSNQSNKQLNTGNSLGPQDPKNKNNQNQQKQSIISNEKNLRDPKHNDHMHIFEKNGIKHEFHKVNKNIDNLAHRSELIDKAIQMVEKAHNNGQLPQKGPFRIQDKLYGNHIFEVRGAVVNQKTYIATFFHVMGCS